MSYNRWDIQTYATIFTISIIRLTLGGICGFEAISQNGIITKKDLHRYSIKSKRAFYLDTYPQHTCTFRILLGNNQLHMYYQLHTTLPYPLMVGAGL